MKLSMIVVLLGVLLFETAKSAEPTRKKVLILGAGLSGITAANQLRKAGIDDFLILEGQNYIGGRIKQISFGGYKVEQGANWIHYALDKETKPIWNFKKRNNVAGIWSNYSDFIIRDEQGNDVTDPKVIHRFHEIEKKLEAAQELRESRGQPDIPARVGLQLMGWNSKTAVEKVVEYFNMDFEYARRPELVSFRQMITRSADFFVTDQRGIITLYKDIYEKFEDKILLAKTIKKIAYNDDEVKVTTTRGEVFVADYVLCTFSTGVLASDMVTFEPPLPVWKKEAILKMPMNVYTKIFLKFDCPKFWDDHEYILLAGHERGFFPVFQDLERKGMFPKGSGMMLITVTEDEGRRIESQSVIATRKEISKMLKGVYGDKACEPDEISYRRWSQNPYTRGSYSEAVVGMSSKDFEKLGKNMGNLYFSGEATSEDWYGYMQGAYITGKAKGKMIARKVKKDKKKGKNKNKTND